MKYLLLLLLLLAPAARAATPAQIIASGKLRCGVVLEPLDWNKTDLHGNLSALDSEICRAMDAALFGRTDRLQLQTYNVEQDALNAVEKGQTDIAVGVTPSFRLATGAIAFSMPFFQDPLTFMVPSDIPIHDIHGIAGHKLCTINDTDNESEALDYLVARGIMPIPFGFQEEGEMDAAIMDRHCQATAALESKLAEARTHFHDAAAFHFLPTQIALVPVSAAVSGHEPALAALVNATLSVLLQAEALGVTEARAATLKQAGAPAMQRLLGLDFATAAAFNLPHDWSRKLIEQTGNYGEIWARTVGRGTPYNLDRGPNALWTGGGTLVPLPLQ